LGTGPAALVKAAAGGGPQAAWTISRVVMAWPCSWRERDAKSLGLGL